MIRFSLPLLLVLALGLPSFGRTATGVEVRSLGKWSGAALEDPAAEAAGALDAGTAKGVGIDPGDFLTEVLDVMESNWLYSSRVDWDDVRRMARQNITGAESPGDTFAAIYTALRLGGDRHSYLLAPDHYARWRGEGRLENGTTTAARDVGTVEALAPSLGAGWRGVPAFEGLEFKLLEGQVGYVKLPPLGSADELLGLAYATQVHEGIRRLAEEAPRGWMVDLRENTGGNCWPMLAGLSSLLGEGHAGSLLGPDLVEHFGIGPGSAWISTPEGVREIQQQVATESFDLGVPQVAVLIGPYTASSGELVATAFRGREATRSFGSRTAGYSTGNGRFELSDGSCLFLTTSVHADRDGVRYPGGLPSDESSLGLEPEGGDPDRDAALCWLQEA